MKLLFDQNISFRLIRKIADVFPEAKQVRELGLENFTDRPGIILKKMDIRS